MNIKRNILLIIVTLLATIATAQRTYETNPDRKRGFNWLFGDSIWLDFKTNPPTQRNGSQLKALESAATISDTAGNLLFYTDGITVWNANHQIIVNGTGLNGNESSSQGSLLIPQPNNDSVFYLFTTDWQGKSKGFCYHTIILDKQNINKSRVKEKNIKLLNGSCESISATNHSNGIWKWVAVHDRSGTGMNAFLITDKGLNICPKKSNGAFNMTYDIFSCQSVSAFSNNSDFYGISAISQAAFEFMSFNNSTGVFNGKFTKQIYTPTAINFINDNKICYVAERDHNLYKINCVDGMQSIVNNHNDSFMFVGSRLTPYNQIYYNIFDSMFIGLVDKPELANAKFKLKGLLLNKKCTNGLTNFDNSYNNTIGVNFTYSINCSNNQVVLKGLDTFNANSFIWKTRQNNTSSWQTIGNTKTLSYTYNDTGVYNIQFIASRGIIKDTITKLIIISSKTIKDFLGNDTVYCVKNFPTLKLQLPDNLKCFKWNVDSTSQSITINNAGKYIATITTNTFCQISDTVTLYEDTILPKPIIIRNGDSLKSNINATQYRWLFNGNEISNNKAIKINQLGIYQLEVFGKGGCSSYSDTVYIIQLSINNIQTNNISIYPNPTQNILEITGLDKSERYKILLSDINGRVLNLLEVNEANQFKINTEHLTNGIYILSIFDQSNHLTIKQFIKL